MMKRFFHENMALAAGIALPLVLIILFALAGYLTRTIVPDPQYAVIFADSYYPDRSWHPYKIQVEGGDLSVIYEETDSERRSHPRLYIFEPGEEFAKEIEIDWSKDTSGAVNSEALTLVNQDNLTDEQPAPDGYALDTKRYYSRGFFPGFFGSARRRGPALVKNGRRILIKTQSTYLSGIRFIAWKPAEASHAR